jgi:hypothetical protein
MSDLSRQLFEGRDDIGSIHLPDDSSYYVGQGNVEKIVVSMEYGQMAAVPWFKIYRGGEVDQLVNAALVSVVSFC